MPELVINCQNLSCPQPVLRCRQAVADGAQSLVVLVDNPAARENVARFLTSQGFTVQVEEHGALIALAAEHAASPKTPDARSAPLPSPAGKVEKLDSQTARKILVLLTSPRIGAGDEVLGAKLMENFLSTLPEMGQELWKLILLNGAVRLAVENSPALPHLRKISESGAQILVCGTCLIHYGMANAKAIGETTNMLDVVTAMQLADSVINL